MTHLKTYPQYQDIIVQSMENDIIKAEVMTEIPNVYLHSLTKGNKALLKNDKLTLSKLPESRFIITIGDYVHKFNSETGLFFKVHHGPSTSYFYTPEAGLLYAITMTRHQGNTLFQPEVNRLTEIYTYERASGYHVFQELIKENYPNPDTPLIDNSKVNQFIEQVGTFVGSGFEVLGGWTASAVDHIGNYVEPKLSPGQMSQKNKDRVEKFTNTTKNISQKVAGAAVSVGEPIVDKGLEVGGKVSQSMDNSKYSGVRAANGVASSTWNAGGKALKGFWNGLCTFGGALYNQSSKIWNKKFYGGAQGEALLEPKDETPVETPNENTDINLKQGPTE